MKRAVVVATLATAGRYALLLFPVLYHFAFSQAAFYTLVLFPSMVPYQWLSSQVKCVLHGGLVECSVYDGATVFGCNAVCVHSLNKFGQMCSIIGFAPFYLYLQ